jgi:hypothetical protein
VTTRAELGAVAMSPEQANTRVAQHPDYAVIEALMRRGKTPEWISRWLDGRYPTEDKDGGDHENATANAGMRIATRAIKRYMDKYMPECGTGITGVINEDLEKLIGYRLPAPVGMPWELEVLETVGIQAAQVNLARAMQSDEEMDMLNPVTMDAHGRLVDVLSKSIDLKSRLGLAGYEAAPEKQQIFTQNENYNVNVSGAIDQATGATRPVEPEKLDLARALLSAPPEERAGIIAAAKEAAAALAAAADIAGEPAIELPARSLRR